MTEAEPTGEAQPRLTDLMQQAAPLEPDAEERRRLAALAVDHVEAFLAGVATASTLVPDTGVADALAAYGLPDLPRDPAEVLSVLGGLVERPGVATTSPRYLGYIPSGGLFHAALADFLAAASNRYAALESISPGAAGLESVVVRLLADVVGLGPDAGGVLTSGGTAATLTAVVAARDTGRILDGGAAPVVYLGEYAHHSVDIALRVAGLATAVVRRLPSDQRLRMDATALADAVRIDRAAGHRPFMIMATAGTTAAGAVDPLNDVADIAESEGLWFHVDGAYGGLFAMTEEGREVLGGLGRADSLVVDPHKTLFLPYGTGAVLVRDARLLEEVFSQSADYLARREEGPPSPADLGPELTRHFRALRVWLPLQLAGRRAFSAALSEKILLARHAHARLAAEPAIEVGPAPDLSIVTFRVAGGPDADAATARLAESLQNEGQVFMTTTRLEGRLAVRIAVGSFRTHLADVDTAVDAVVRVARTLDTVHRSAPASPLTLRRAASALDTRKRLEFQAGHADAQVLACELEVLRQWYGDTTEELEEAYGVYAPSTVWLAVREPSGRVVGWCRLITPSPLPQKTLTDVSKEPWNVDGRRAAAAVGLDPDAAWDIATIGVRRELGGAGAAVAAALYHGIIAATGVNEVASILAMLDARVLRLLRRLGLVMHPLPGAEPRSYMGSPAIVPVYAHMAEVARDQQREDPEQYRKIALGEGLTEFVLPRPEAFRLPPAVLDLREAQSRPA